MNPQNDVPAGPLSCDEQRRLRAVAGSMVPSSATHGMPGADDPVIFAGILQAAEEDPQPLRLALSRLDALSGGDFASMTPSGQAALAAELRQRHPDSFLVLVTLVVRFYYRDDRVMRVIGMEPRAPFPQGFVVEQGDWSLLAPVRARPAFYRKAP